MNFVRIQDIALKLLTYYLHTRIVILLYYISHRTAWVMLEDMYVDIYSMFVSYCQSELRINICTALLDSLAALRIV